MLDTDKNLTFTKNVKQKKLNKNEVSTIFCFKSSIIDFY